MRLLGAALLDQGAELGGRSVLVPNPINENLEAVAAISSVCSYPCLKILLRHGLDLE